MDLIPVVVGAIVEGKAVVVERMDEVVIVMNVVPVDWIGDTILEVTIGLLIDVETVFWDVDAFKVVVDVKVIIVVVVIDDSAVDCGWCKVVLPVVAVKLVSKVESVVIWLIMVVFKSLLDVELIVDEIWLSKSFVVLCKVVVSSNVPVSRFC